MSVKCPKCQTNNPSDYKYCKECANLLPSTKEVSVFATETLETPIEELTTGSLFAGRYQIIEELGKGGMGRVYKVHDTEIREKVALKLIKPEIATDLRTIERFQNELKFARKIRHQNICQMYDINKAEGRYYITMEYVSGDDLKGMIRMMGRLSAGQAITIAKQVCEGLAEAHRSGVIHRDLKPSNIMIDREGTVRIMDFGIARSLKSRGITGAGMMVGTPEYMSPEQVEGKEADERSDIYALGVILYEMLTGRVPFEGDTPFVIGVKHKSEIPQDPKDFNPQISEDLSSLILRSLEKDKERRYQKAGELLAELAKIEKGIPTAEKVLPRGKPLTSKEITVSFNLKKLLVPTVSLVVLVTIGIVLWRVLHKDSSAGRIASLAVLPLKSMNVNPAESEYLADGITEALIMKFSQLRDLRVIPWMTVEQYKNSSKPVQKMSEEMKVDALMTGTLRKSGERIRVAVSLIDGRSGFQLWGEEIEEELTNIFSVQKTIALGVASKLQVSLAGEQEQALVRAPSSSAEAYEYSLRGSAVRVQNKEANDLAFGLFQKALELDPGLAEAHTGLGRVHWNRYYFGWEGDLKNLEEAEACYERALELNPVLSTAYQGLIEINWLRGESEECLKLGQRVERLGLDDPPSLYARARAYYFAGLYDKSISLLKRIIEIDAANREAHYLFVPSYLYNLDYQKAIDAGDEYLRKFGDRARTHLYTAEAYHCLGDLEKARYHHEKSVEIAPDDFVVYRNLGVLYKQSGHPEKARESWLKGVKIIKKMLGAYPRNPRVRAWLASFYGYLGDKEALLREESQALSELPDNGYLIKVLGIGRGALGETDKAMEYFHRAFLLGEMSFYELPTLKSLGLEYLQDSGRIRDFLKKYTETLDRLRAIY